MTANHKHTPDTARIKDAYRRSRVWESGNGSEAYEKEFDRWLATITAAAEQRGAIAAQLCLADNTMEHHEQTDDFPCTRCIKKAGRAIENRADRIANKEGDGA